MPDNQVRHSFCPRESNSWCKYWQHGGSEDDKSFVNLPKVIKYLLVAIIFDFWDNNLLCPCLEGTTENPNEAIHQITWKKWPKNIFTSRHKFEIGVKSSVINFNDGVIGLNWIFQSLDLLLTKYSVEGALDKDINRVIKMDKKTQEIKENTRKKKRTIRKVYIDKEHKQDSGQ